MSVRLLTGIATLVLIAAACDMHRHQAMAAQPNEGAAPTAAPAQGQAQTHLRFSIDTPIHDLAGNAQAKAIVDSHVRGLTEGPHALMLGSFSLRQLQPMMHGMISEAALDEINRQLATIQ